jgi:predicted PurR-regulated permease PerM
MGYLQKHIDLPTIHNWQAQSIRNIHIPVIKENIDNIDNDMSTNDKNSRRIGHCINSNLIVPSTYYTINMKLTKSIEAVMHEPTIVSSSIYKSLNTCSLHILIVVVVDFLRYV